MIEDLANQIGYSTRFDGTAIINLRQRRSHIAKYAGRWVHFYYHLEEESIYITLQYDKQRSYWKCIELIKDISHIIDRYPGFGNDYWQALAHYAFNAAMSILFLDVQYLKKHKADYKIPGRDYISFIQLGDNE